MRITSSLIISILLTFSLSISPDRIYSAIQISRIVPLQINAHRDYSNFGCNNSPFISQLEDRDINKLIISGKEDEIKQYFNEVTADELMRSDSGAIVKAINRLNTNDKVTRTIWILQEVKNRTVEIKTYIYSELIKVEYGKPSFFLKHMINNFFTNYNENEVTLLEKVRKLQKKMNR